MFDHTFHFSQTFSMDEIALLQAKSEAWGRSRFTETGQYGCYGRGPGQHSLCVASMALLPDSEGIIVLDWMLCKLCVFGLHGGLLREFGTKGEGDGQFQRPCGVAVSTRGQVFVSDHSQHRIQMFTKEGVFFRAFGSKGSGDGQFHCPTSMCFMLEHLFEEHLVICDEGNNRVQLFLECGMFVRSFGMEQSQDGSNLTPEFVCSDWRDGSIVVCGKGENDGTEFHSVQQFTAAGSYVRTIGSEGDGPGQFRDPQGVCISPYGHVLVADYAKGEVAVFDAAGEYVQSVGGCASVWRVEADWNGEHLYVIKDRIPSGGVFFFERHNPPVWVVDNPDESV